MSTNQGFKSFVPPNDIDSSYLYYYLQCAREIAVALSSGTTFQEISGAKAALIPLALAPLPEQHRVVAAIEEHFTRLDAAVAALRRVRANLKRYRASVLKAACEGRLVPTAAELARAEGRGYEPASVLLERVGREQATNGRTVRPSKKADVGLAVAATDLPEGWAWARLPELGELNRGRSRHRPRDDAKLYGGPYPFIQTGDVRHSGGWIRSHTQTYSETGLAQSRLWPENTLCITIAANIAETGILTYPACFPDSVVGFFQENDLVITRYVELFLRTARDELSRFAPATAQKNINLETLSEVRVPLPPLSEQVRIVAELDARLSVVDEVEATVEQQLQRAERLRQAILKRAFAGKLVPQDPTDEPASVLLERIRAERRAQQQPARPRRGRGGAQQTLPLPGLAGQGAARGRTRRAG